MAAAYGWQSEDTQSSTGYQLANDEVAEVVGCEIFGPNVGAARQKIKSVRMRIDGHINERITFNELNAPNRTGHETSLAGYPMLDSVMGIPVNLGRGMLMGHRELGHAAWNATPKVGPGEKLEVEVSIPSAAEGGAALADNMRVRLWMVKIKGEEKLIEMLTRNGHLDQSKKVICDFDVGDLETSAVMPLTTVQKRVPYTNRDFNINDWTRLLGGNDCDKPLVENQIGYADNAAATTANAWYELTQEGNRVVDSTQELKWNFGKYEAMKIEYLGIRTHPHLRYLRVHQHGRAFEQVYRVDEPLNPFPAPRTPYTTDMVVGGPGKLGRGFWLWREQGGLEIKDDGTSIPAWSATNYGAELMYWGKHFELTGGE